MHFHEINMSMRPPATPVNRMFLATQWPPHAPPQLYPLEEELISFFTDFLPATESRHRIVQYGLLCIRHPLLDTVTARLICVVTYGRSSLFLFLYGVLMLKNH